MITKKICLLGAASVGKTSLVRRFVYSTFSDKYYSTIGVKIDKKIVSANGQEINLLIWDIQGEDRYEKVLSTYLRGMSGYFLVVDVSSPESADAAIQLYEQAKTIAPNSPFVLIFSKCDLVENPHTKRQVVKLESLASASIKTSALQDEGVEQAFLTLANRMIQLRKAG